jgi:hypothetical protein
MSGFMAVHAKFHGWGKFQCNRVVFLYTPVAAPTLDVSVAMPRVAEENEIRYLVDPLAGRQFLIRRWSGQPPDHRAILLHRSMARHAFRRRGK